MECYIPGLTGANYKWLPIGDTRRPQVSPLTMATGLRQRGNFINLGAVRIGTAECNLGG